MSLEGVAQKGYGAFGSQKQPAAFENQGPKYVKVYFL